MDQDPERDVVASYLAASDALCALTFHQHTDAELLTVLADLEIAERRRATISHRILARLRRETNPVALGATSLKSLLSDRLRIAATDAQRRLDDAGDLGPRISLLGEPQEPELPLIAGITARGLIGADHIATIRRFFATLPIWVDLAERQRCEATLALHAPGLTPEELGALVKRLRAYIDQDGPEPDDAERARRRTVHFDKQQPNGMVAIHGELSPQAWATVEPILAKFAAPGMCNPDDEHPCITGTPSQAQIDADDRSYGQRVHDALVAVLRIALTGGNLGQHNGLPVSIIITTTLQDLQAAAATPPTPADTATPADTTDSADRSEPTEPAEAAEPDDHTPDAALPPTGPLPATSTTAVTAGGSLLPMSDVIRMASHAYHYLTIFDKHTNEVLYCGRTKRIAPKAHRIVLYARDRGCTKPGCTVPAYGTQVHHTKGWARNHGQTNIDEEVLACGPDNRLAEHGWTVTLGPHGVQWIPPPELDTGQPRHNNYFHPERLLAPPELQPAQHEEDSAWSAQSHR